MANACLYPLTLGRRHFKYAPSSYRVCLTPTQAKHLFGTEAKPKPLGCGVFACVFSHRDPDKVVKITRDPSDVAGLTQAQGLRVPTLHESHKLKSRVWWTSPRQRISRYQEWPERPEAFALVLEKLRPLSGAERRMWSRRIGRAQLFEKTQDRPVTTEEKARYACPKVPKAEAESCRRLIYDLDEITESLRARGIDWTDVHGGNVGFDAQGRLKVLDLGATTTELTTEPPELAGRRRKR